MIIKDEAILEGIITQLENAYKVSRKDILVFTNNQEQTRKDMVLMQLHYL